MNHNTHTPLVHLTKRREMVWYKSWGIKAGALILALLVNAVITMLVTGDNPLQVYGTMFYGCFGTNRRIWNFAQELAILLCVALALTPAFKMRFWNLGGEGQILAGGLACAACMILLGNKVPSVVLIILMLLTSLAAGAIWALIPAVCKAKWGTNETLFTLMMNYVATQLVAFFIIVWEVPKGSGQIGIINQSTEAGWLPQIAGHKYMLNVLIVLALTIGIYIYLSRSKQGFEISVVGGSEQTARYIGISVSRVILRTLAISGAICGLTGFLLVGGTSHTITTTIAGGRGFTAVMVAWLAKFNPPGMLISSFLLIFFSQGASEIASTFSLNQSFSDIMMGVVLFFIIGSEFFVNYKLNFRKNAGKEAA